MLTCVEAKTVDCEVCLRGNMEERTLKTDEPRKTRNWQLICTFISTLPQEGMLTDLVDRTTRFGAKWSALVGTSSTSRIDRNTLSPTWPSASEG